jgi:hypothetical protein
MADSGFSLKKLFTMGAIGTAITLGGVLLLPFVAKTAGAAAIMPGATYGSVASSFHLPLFTDAATGATGVMAGVSDMAHGVPALAKSIFYIGKAIFDPNTSVAEALATPFP